MWLASSSRHNKFLIIAHASFFRENKIKRLLQSSTTPKLPGRQKSYFALRKSKVKVGLSQPIFVPQQRNVQLTAL